MLPSLRIRLNKWVGIHCFCFCISVDQLTPQKIEHIIEFEEDFKEYPLSKPSNIINFLTPVYTQKRNTQQKIIKSNKHTYND